jgi:hypothetical protein
VPSVVFRRCLSMELAALILGIVALVLAIISIALVFAIERARAPKIVIEPGKRHWPEASPFCHLAVSNQRHSGWLGRRFLGVTATNCRASMEFLRAGVSVLGPIPARWSGAPEPRDPAEFPNSYRWDLAATSQPEQLAVARCHGETVHAFSAESYAYPAFQKPDWRLDPAEYDVVIVVSASEVETMEKLRLVVGDDGRAWLDMPEGGR